MRVILGGLIDKAYWQLGFICYLILYEYQGLEKGQIELIFKTEADFEKGDKKHD